MMFLFLDCLIILYNTDTIHTVMFLYFRFELIYVVQVLIYGAREPATILLAGFKSEEFVPNN